jgi:hypothetical protein
MWVAKNQMSGRKRGKSWQMRIQNGITFQSSSQKSINFLMLLPKSQGEANMVAAFSSSVEYI